VTLYIHYIVLLLVRHSFGLSREATLLTQASLLQHLYYTVGSDATAVVVQPVLLSLAPLLCLSQSPSLCLSRSPSLCLCLPLPLPPSPSASLFSFPLSNTLRLASCASRLAPRLSSRRHSPPPYAITRSRLLKTTWAYGKLPYSHPPQNLANHAHVACC